MPDVLQALRDFIARADRLDPEAPIAGELTLHLADSRAGTLDAAPRETPGAASVGTPDAASAGTPDAGPGDRAERLTLRRPVAAALVEALAAYHDPRDHGACAHCGTGALDADFVCRSCGIVNGVFGRTLADHLVRDRALESRDPAPAAPGRALESGD